MPHDYLPVSFEIRFYIKPARLNFHILIFYQSFNIIKNPKSIMSHITHITAAQRLDSRGNPTVQVRLTTNKGNFPHLFISLIMTLHHGKLE